MRRREVVLTLLLWPAAIAAARQAERKSMTNSDVIGLTKAGISPDLIIEKIYAANATDFDTGVEGLKALQAAQVSPVVIRLMINPRASEPAHAPVQAVAANPGPDSDDPVSNHPPGIYLYAASGAGHQLIELQHAKIKETKGSGAWLSGMTYGIKKFKIRGVLEGANAPVKTADPNPAFYLYINVDQTSFGGSGLNPNDFTLVKFTQKNDAREIVEGSGSIWGNSIGTDDKAKKGFTVEQIKPGISKLSLLEPLPPGQYGFSQNRGMFFDFAVLTAE